MNVHMQKLVSIQMNCETDSDIDLVALMQAFNDIATATNLLVSSDEEPKADSIGDKIANAERAYYFRLICGHLNEGLNAFNRFCGHSDVKNIVERFNSDHIKVYRELLVDANDKEGIRRKCLKDIRTAASFHYNATPIRAAYKRLYKKGLTFDIVLADKYKDVRYLAADHIFASMFKCQTGNSFEELRSFVTKVRDVQINMMRFLDFYLAYSGKAQVAELSL